MKNYRIIARKLDRAVGSLNSAESALKDAIGFYTDARNETKNEATFRRCELAIDQLSDLLGKLNLVDTPVDNANVLE